MGLTSRTSYDCYDLGDWVPAILLGPMVEIPNGELMSPEDPVKITILNGWYGPCSQNDIDTFKMI